MSEEKVWIEWNEFLKFLQKNRHLLPMPVTLSSESLDGLLKIDAELKRLRRSLEAANFTDEGGEYWKPPVNHKYRELWEEKEQLREAVEWAISTMKMRTEESWWAIKFVDELRRLSGKATP